MTLDPIEAFPRKEELVRENSSIELRMASVDITKTTLFTSRNLFSIPNDGSNTKPMFPIFFSYREQRLSLLHPLSCTCRR